MEKTQNTNLLNNITFDIVKDQAIKDRTKEYMEDLQAQQKTSVKSKTNEELVDLDEVDSEEERIMRKELERRMGETQHRREITKKKLSEKYGDYREIIETEFLDTMLKNKKVVCHFYHKEFERCKIMDNHLRKIAMEHPETLFVKIDAEKTPFFTTKLNVRVLPTVILFNDGKAINRIIGFADLGMTDDFPTINLTRRLVTFKMIVPKNKAEKGEISIHKGKDEDEDDSDESY